MAVCVGCGLQINPTSGLLEVLVRPGGGIGCDNAGSDAGLYLTGATTTGSNCIDVAGGVVSINRSEDACNAIECRANGLFVPCPEGHAGIQNAASPQIGDIPLTMTGTGPSSYNFESEVTTITNPSNCCSLGGVISFMTNFQGTVPVNGYFTVQMFIQPDGGAYIGANPSAYEIVHNVGNATMQWGINLWDTGWYPFDPGQTRTFRSKATFTNIAGTTSVIAGGGQFETQWTLVPTSCGC